MVRAEKQVHLLPVTCYVEVLVELYNIFFFMNAKHETKIHASANFGEIVTKYEKILSTKL